MNESIVKKIQNFLWVKNYLNTTHFNLLYLKNITTPSIERSQEIGETCT